MRNVLLRAALTALFVAGTPLPRCAGAPVVIRAPLAFTGREFVENVVIVVEEDVITDVVDADEYVARQGAEVIDAQGLTVLPGFVDSHVHILGLPLEVVKDTARRGWGRLAEESISQVPGNREQLLQSGITTVVDMGSTTSGVTRLAEGLRAGKLVGPRLYYCGPLFSAPGGHPAGTIYRGMHDLIDNATVEVRAAEPARVRVAELAGRGASFIKVVYDDGTSYGRRVPRLEQTLVEEIAGEAHSRGLPVVAHLGAREEAFSDMLASKVDAIEHCFPYSESDTVLAAMKDRGIIFTPTLSIYEIFATAQLPRMLRSVGRARELGVTIAAGTDFPSSRFTNAGEGFYRELALLEQAGLSRRDVLEAATVNGARKIGKEGEVGMIAPGCRADLLLVAGDVRVGELSPRRAIRVIQGGRTVASDGAMTPESRPGLSRQSMMVFPFGFYETLTGVSAGVSFLHFNLLGTGAALGLTATYSFANCGGAELTVSSPSPVPLTSLDFRVAYDGYPKRYFGGGNSASLPDAVRFDWTSVEAAVMTGTRIAPTIVLSTTLLLQYAAIPEGSALPAMAGDGGGLLALVRAEIAHDGRDSPAAPWYGDFESVGASFSYPWIGSSYSYALLELDLRYFLSIARHHVLAGHFALRHSLGDPPFYAVPSLGGNFVGRGFQPRRFAGPIALLGQLEYRFPIWSIIGGVLFFDTGQVCGDYVTLLLDGFHSSGGAGLRFAFSERSILSVDVGFTGEPISQEGVALVVRSSHAF